jgi:FtsP/CotA-like multicopper oxidase with cupredoxin domain
MHSGRRSFLRGLATLTGAATARAAYGQHVHAPPSQKPAPPPSTARAAVPVHALGPGIVPVVTPDVPDMPWRMEGGVKVFDLTVEHVRTEFVPGRVVDAWGFNGSVPGPTIQVNEGDRVRLVVENRLPEPFSMHWHGLEIPVEMDGMPGISQDAIAPGARFTYEFTLRQNGTFFYHSHMAMQEMMGLIGLFIIHPRRAHAPAVDRDFGIVLQGWAILPNNTVPNTLAMEFNWLTMNGRSGPATTPLIVRLGERVRIRLVNLSMDHHPIHMHGHTFYMTGTEAGRIRTPTAPENTVLVGVAQARDVEFVADNEGDWHLHCHLPHHMMNQMVSMVGPIMTSHANRHQPRAMQVGAVESSPNAGMFPGYPQDMAMAMDELVAKPETHGLRRGWSGGTMGMMTIVRVLKPELFEKIQALKAEQAGKAGAR